jgi:hypothetical protein
MGIRTIGHDEALDWVWEELVYTEARLLGDPLTPGLAPPVTNTLERHQSVQLGQKNAWRSEIVAQAMCDGADVALDETVPEVSRNMLLIEKGNRKSARYVRYFASAPNAIQRLGLASEVERVRPWVPSLKGEPEQALQDLGARLEGEVAVGASALTQRETSATARADHRVREIYRFIDDVNALRLATYGQLLDIASRNKRSRSWAESFFRRTQREPRATTPEPTPAP